MIDNTDVRAYQDRLSAYITLRANVGAEKAADCVRAYQAIAEMPEGKSMLKEMGARARLHYRTTDLASPNVTYHREGARDHMLTTLSIIQITSDEIRSFEEIIKKEKENSNGSIDRSRSKRRSSTSRRGWD